MLDLPGNCLEGGRVVTGPDLFNPLPFVVAGYGPCLGAGGGAGTGWGDCERPGGQPAPQAVLRVSDLLSSGKSNMGTFIAILATEDFIAELGWNLSIGNLKLSFI